MLNWNNRSSTGQFTIDFEHLDEQLTIKDVELRNWDIFYIKKLLVRYKIKLKNIDDSLKKLAENSKEWIPILLVKNKNFIITPSILRIPTKN